MSGNLMSLSFKTVKKTREYLHNTSLRIGEVEDERGGVSSSTPIRLTRDLE